MEETKKKEFKETLNLPSTTLAMRANAAVREVEIQKFWDENKIYEKNINQRDKKNAFILHDGPPYLSSDKIHIGTALNKILKDIVIKYKSQKGYFAPYIPGYDAHGLPIENAVAKNIKGGKDAVSPFELRKMCREFAMKNLKGQEANFRRLGVWGDWEHPYLSIAPEFEAEQIRVFGEIYKKGYIQKGLKPVYWCSHCETALAEAEVEYQDVTSDSIYVRFEVLDKDKFLKAFNLSSLEKPCYMVIWTTTPWTIPSNLAISLHPDYEYGLYKFEGEYYVVAVELLSAFAKDIEKEESDFELVAKTRGINLENIDTKHPILDRKSKIIVGEHVTLDAGTGAVHTAPGHGLEDWEVCQKYGIETFSPLDKKGRWTNQVPELEGVYYEEGNDIVINKLTEKKALMKVASLIGDNGIDINQFQKIMKLGSKDDLNQLIQDGWLMISGDVISMHRVIQEAVHRWDWTPEYINAAEQLLTYFYVEIRLESTKNNYPKKLRHQIMAGSAELPPELRNKWIFRKLNACSRRWCEKQYDKHGLAGAVYRERSARIKDEAPADIKKLTWLLSQAENIITQCQREKVIYDTDLYINLQITVLLNMPRYREDFIFSETSRILAENAKTIDFGDYTNAKRDIRQDAIGIMQIYELVFSIHAAHGDTKAMKSLLDTAGKAAKYFRKREAYAIYYNMVSDYYDILLDGAYDTDNPDEVLLLDEMLDAIEKTLHYSKWGISYDGNHLYAKNILAKATVLMRGRRGTEKEIGALIETAKKIITENTLQFAYVRLQYNLVCAWYFALERDDTVSTDVFVKEARELSDIIIPTDLQKIEEVIIPCANIYFELNCYDKAMALLYEGTRICTKHANMDSYAHIRQELCDHLWEVGIKAHQFEWCQKTIERIEAENEEIVDLKNRVVIPDEVRNIITNR